MTKLVKYVDQIKEEKRSGNFLATCKILSSKKHHKKNGRNQESFKKQDGTANQGGNGVC